MDTAVAGSHVGKSRPASDEGLKGGLGEREHVDDGLHLDLDLGLLLDLLLVSFLGLFLGLFLDFNLGFNLLLLRSLDSGLRLGLLLVGLGSNSLGGALDELAIASGSLDQPVITAVAGNTFIDTSLAEIKVAVVAGGTVIVHVGNGPLAVVTADGEVGAGGRANGRGDRGEAASGEGR